MNATIFKSYTPAGKPEIDCFLDSDVYDPQEYAGDQKYEFALPDDQLENEIDTRIADPTKFKNALEGVDRETLINIAFAQVNRQPEFLNVEEVREIVRANLRKQITDEFLEQCYLEVRDHEIPEDGYCIAQFCVDGRLTVRNGKIVCSKCGAVYREEAA